MKRGLILLVLLCVLFIPIWASADSDAIDKGSIFFKIGTLFSFDYYWNGYFDGPYETTAVRFGSGPVNLNVHYFLVDGLAVGGIMYVNFEKLAGDSGPTTMLSIGPVASCFHALNERFLLNGSFYLRIVEVNMYNFLVTDQLTVGLGAGVTYMIHENIGFYVEAAFYHVTNASVSGGYIQDSGYNNFNVSIGISVIFQTKPIGWF
jgi:hypothetical protein